MIKFKYKNPYIMLYEIGGFLTNHHKIQMYDSDGEFCEKYSIMRTDGRAFPCDFDTLEEYKAFKEKQKNTPDSEKEIAYLSRRKKIGIFANKKYQFSTRICWSISLEDYRKYPLPFEPDMYGVEFKEYAIKLYNKVATQQDLMRFCDKNKIEVDFTKHFLCNKCGNLLLSEMDCPYGLVNTRITGGYESTGFEDCRSYKFNICEDCLTDIFKTFEIPVTERAYDI